MRGALFNILFFNRAQPWACGTLGRNKHPLLGKRVKPTVWQISIHPSILAVADVLGHSAEIINGQARLCVSGAHSDAQSPFGDEVSLFR